MKEAIEWLRHVIAGDLAEATGLLSDDWSEQAWAVTECGNNEAHHCPCIVYQGQYKPFDEAQVPLIRYVADGETPELAAWIARHDPRNEIARCEAELAILDAYDRAWKVAEFPDEAGGFANGLEEAVKLLASGYKHREGYSQRWEGQ